MKMKNLKKALAFTAVLAFLGAGTVFAQDADTDEAADETAAAPVAAPAPAPAPSGAGLDVAGGKLKIGAYINSGVEVSKFKDTDSTIRPYGQDANKSSRIQVDLGWTSGNSVFGANVRLRADDIFATNKDFYFPYYAYAWYKPIQYFSVSGGIVDDGAFTTLGNYAKNALSNYFASSAGGLFHVLPIKIVDLGFGVFAPKDKGPDDAGQNVVYYAGAAINTKLVTVHGSGAFKEGLNNALFSVSTGLADNLTLALEGCIFNENNYIGKWSYGGLIQGKANDTYGFWGDLNAAYSLGNLGISLVAYYYANDYDTGGPSAYQDWYEGVYKDIADGIIDFTIQPGVSYALLDGKVVPGIDFLIGHGNGKPLAKFSKDPYSAYAGLGDMEVSQTRIQVKPYIDFPVGKGRIEVAYQLQHDSVTVSGLGDYQSKGDSIADGATGITHTVYLDFLFKY